MTLATFLTPLGFAALLAWCFAVLAAVQLTIRLIMAFSLRVTLVGTVVLAALSLPVALCYDLATGPDPSFATRLAWAPLPMGLMALAGFATARWTLHLRRTRGQIVAALMVGALAPHLFTLAPPLA